MKDRKLLILTFISKYNRVDISEFSVEDFVLDGSFRMWVLYPSRMSNIRWVRLLRENPGQFHKAKIARQIVFKLSTKHFRLSDCENSGLWGAIESELDDLDSEPECKIETTRPGSVLIKHEFEIRPVMRRLPGLEVSLVKSAVGLSLN
jgi:hypothetical protein